MFCMNFFKSPRVASRHLVNSDIRYADRRMKKTTLKSAVRNCASKFGMQCDDALYGNNTFDFLK